MRYMGGVGRVKHFIKVGLAFVTSKLKRLDIGQAEELPPMNVKTHVRNLTERPNHLELRPFVSHAQHSCRIEIMSPSRPKPLRLSATTLA